MTVEYRNRFTISLAIFLVLASIYLLTYSGLFRSIDELVLFVMTDRVAQARPFDPHPLQFASYHAPTSSTLRFEPLLSLVLLPLYTLGRLVSFWGNIQTLLLSNIFVSAATVSLLWLLLQEMEYSPRTAAVVALLYGLGTLIWPYSRTLFREPTVALLLGLAIWTGMRYRRSGEPLWAGFCLAIYVLAVGIKIENLLLFSLFPLSLIVLAPRPRFPILLASGAAVLVASGLFLISVLYRYGTINPAVPFQSDYASNGLRDWAIALYGLTFSPGKGLLIYSPVLLLGLLGLSFLHRKDPVLTRLILAVFTLYLAFYALLADWWGGTDWGPRYLVPLSFILSIPLAEAWSQGARWRAAMLVVGLPSVAVQIVASTSHWGVYYGELFSRYPNPEVTVLLDPRNWALSPVLGQLATWRPQNFDLIWARGGVLDWGLLGIPLLLAVVSSAFLRASFFPSLSGNWLDRGLVLGLFGLGLGLFLAQAFQGGATYPNVDTPSLRAVAETINSTPDRRLIVSVAEDFSHNTFLNFLKGSFDHYWFSPWQGAEDFGILEPLMVQADRIFLVTDRLPSPTGMEIWLDQHAFRYLIGWETERLLIGYFPPTPLPPPVTSGVRWAAGMELASLSFTPEVAKLGAPLRLEFRFQAYKRISGDYILYVHLNSTVAGMVAGMDGPPQFGVAPTSRWRIGQEVVDRRALVIPPEVPPGEYWIEIGFYQGEERVPLLFPDGEAQDYLVIGRVFVE